MRRRWRNWRGNPNASVRLGQIAVLGALVAGAVSRGDNSLVNIIALLFVAASAWSEGKYADAVHEFWPSQVRRGALIRLAVGVLLVLGSLLLPGLIDSSDRGPIDALTWATLFGGLALVCGASARLLMSDGARYAGRKLQERLDDDF
jgi:hypothetical protein